MINLIKKILIFFLLFIFLISCEHDFPVEPVFIQRAELISYEFLSSVKADNLKTLTAGFNIDESLKTKFIYDVDVYKIIYTTLSPQGRIVKASGSIFIPKGIDNLSILSVHHRTQSKRSNVGSVNPYYAIEGFAGAAAGYFTIVPDYLGLGESNIIHPYHHAKSSADAVIDFIKTSRIAAQILGIKLNGQVFLIGYSEGGYVTLAAQREIEKNYRNEINITASAPMAGAYDLYLTAQLILKNKFYTQPSFLAFLIKAYNEIYGWNKIDSIFNSPYAEKISKLFDGTRTTSEINAELTNDLTKLFNQKFLNSFLDGSEKEFTAALKENSLINFVPASPTKLFHGDADEFVPYENSLKAQNYFNSHGAKVELVTIKNGTHTSSAIPSIISAMEWFESFKIKKMIASKSTYIKSIQ
ncbi:MAG: lipase family protein [Melioribacteraceae bacterium]